MKPDDRSRDTLRHDATTARRPAVSPVYSPLPSITEQLVSRVMDCAFTVHRALGPGFKESIYSQALKLEMTSQGLAFEAEKSIEVKYRHWRIPGQRVDLLVAGLVLVEIKSVPRFRPIHSSQVLSYLRTLDLRIGLLINFRARYLKDGFKRVIN